MKTWIVLSIGFFAQILFSGRLLVQWALSERAKKVVTPALFWQMSLLASLLLFIYGYLRDDFSIMLGQTLTYFIYIRNLHLQGSWQKAPFFLRTIIIVVPIAIVLYGFNNNKIDVANLFRNDAIPLWLLIWGSAAQIIFTLRFVYQWLYSEKNKESSLPLGFWLLSLIGSLAILGYAIVRKDPVLFIGHLFGSIVYGRNIILLKKST
ncbi:lipid-A-disaccharide synthase N-terminal domain-containing protein [Urechidicola sp. KH5]